MNNNYFKTFYTPIFHKSINPIDFNFDSINQLLIKLQESQWTNESPSQSIETGVFESPHQLFQRPEKMIAILANELNNCVRDFVKDINDYTDFDMSRIKSYAAAWFHITEKRGFVQPHNHPNASWSVVLCTQSGNHSLGSNDHTGVAELVIMNPACNPMYIDAGNANINLPMASDNIRFTLKTGDFLIFPSNLMHFVTPHLTDIKRITIAANFWFK